MKKILLAIVLLQLLAFSGFAQDKIYTKLQKTPIEGEVTEVGINEVKYKPVDRPYPVSSIDKQDVIKIVYKNGQTLVVNNPLNDFAMYNDQHKWNLKLGLLSPLLGHTQLFLEHSQKPGRSVEYELNIIGLGKDQYMNDWYADVNDMVSARGLGAGIGMKFLRLPDYINGQVRLRHILQGSYIKPAVSLNVYSRNFIAPGQFGYTLERKTVFALHPNVSVGKQWILDNTFSLEIYGLVGYCFDNVRSSQQAVLGDNGQYSYEYRNNIPFNGFGFTRFSSGDFGLTLGAGIRVGFLFDFKEKK